MLRYDPRLNDYSLVRADVVWSESKQVGLIDSILRNFYIPPVIFGEHNRSAQYAPLSSTCHAVFQFRINMKMVQKPRHASTENNGLPQYNGIFSSSSHLTGRLTGFFVCHRRFMDGQVGQIRCSVLQELTRLLRFPVSNFICFYSLLIAIYTWQTKTRELKFQCQFPRFV